MRPTKSHDWVRRPTRAPAPRTSLVQGMERAGTGAVCCGSLCTPSIACVSVDIASLLADSTQRLRPELKGSSSCFAGYVSSKGASLCIVLKISFGSDLLQCIACSCCTASDLADLNVSAGGREAVRMRTPPICTATFPRIRP